MRRVIGIIQARMGATRLPGKTLLDIGGEPMLGRVVRRAVRAGSLDGMVVATTCESQDDPIAAAASTMDVGVFRGDEQDVLDRYYKAADAVDADVVVRLTADCPLIDPDVIDRVVVGFLNASPPVDFASNTLRRSYPQGLDVEAVSFTALEQAWEKAEPGYMRSHVMPFIYRQPERFRLLSVTQDVDLSHLRWTVDTEDDLDFVRAVYERMGNDDAFSWREAVRALMAEPGLVRMNAHVRQKALEEG